MKKQIIAFFIGLVVFSSASLTYAASEYIVEKGDSLWKIAQQKNVTVKDLQQWNQLSTDLIYPGDRLLIEPASIEASKMKEPEGKELQVTATAYTAYCAGCSGTTATGIDLRANPNQKVIAVDPSVIPLGSKVWVEGYGEAIAGDTGGAIKGNKIDIFVPTKDEAINWGVKTVTVKVLE